MVSDLIYSEFFSQGDLEKALGVTPIEMMDTSLIPCPKCVRNRGFTVVAGKKPLTPLISPRSLTHKRLQMHTPLFLFHVKSVCNEQEGQSTRPVAEGTDFV